MINIQGESGFFKYSCNNKFTFVQDICHNQVKNQVPTLDDVTHRFVEGCQSMRCLIIPYFLKLENLINHGIIFKLTTRCQTLWH